VSPVVSKHLVLSLEGWGLAQRRKGAKNCMGFVGDTIRGSDVIGDATHRRATRRADMTEGPLADGPASR